MQHLENQDIGQVLIYQNNNNNNNYNLITGLRAQAKEIMGAVKAGHQAD